ncbi:MAG: hypothetical protein K0M40_18400 [Prolixibacteraceae bacterium]|nr:hypothetical protein [Prolixibacteraceae bacterium]
MPDANISPQGSGNTYGLFSSWFKWFCNVESIDLESEELTTQIGMAYQKTLDIEKGDHLKVARIA